MDTGFRWADRGRTVLVGIGLGLLGGLLAGLASFLFLESLTAAIDLREQHAAWLVWLLPDAAFVISAVYHHWGDRARESTGLVLLETDSPSTAGVPARMAPLVLGGTVAAHLFGASVGREGVALQMAGSLADSSGRRLGLDDRRRRVLLHAALAGGFGSVFGAPWTAMFFTFEVRRRRPDLSTVTAAVVAGFTGDRVVTGLGHRHHIYPLLSAHLSIGLVSRAAIAGVVFGMCATLFVTSVSMIRRQLGRVRYPPFRAAIAGTIVAIGAAVLGRQYLSLSLPLATGALNGTRPSGFAWLAKLGLTAVSLGGGIPGGEVTPLFVIGAALGGALAVAIHAPISVFAGLGFVAVFGAAAKTPVTCIVLFVELFGPRLALLAAVACLVARLVSGATGIYPAMSVGPRATPDNR